MSYILVDSVRYRVIETLSAQAVGMPAKLVATREGDRVIVRQRGVWRFWTAADRVGPLRAHLQRLAE